MSLTQFTTILRTVKNPLPVYLDWAGLLKKPYLVHTHDGFQCELRPGMGDRYAMYEALLRRDYFGHGPCLAPGATVIDIGANIGCFALLAGRMVGPTGRVIALEPEPRTYKQLVSNVARNRLDNVTARPVAVGAHAGTMSLRTGDNALFSSIFPQVGAHQLNGPTYDVAVVTLEQVMNEAGIDRCDYLKVDCEGAEYEVFLNMMPDVANRIERICMEVHMVDGYHPRLIEGRLRDLGFQVQNDMLLHAWR